MSICPLGNGLQARPGDHPHSRIRRSAESGNETRTRGSRTQSISISGTETWATLNQADDARPGLWPRSVAICLRPAARIHQLLPCNGGPTGSVALLRSKRATGFRTLSAQSGSGYERGQAPRNLRRTNHRARGLCSRGRPETALLRLHIAAIPAAYASP